MSTMICNHCGGRCFWQGKALELHNPICEKCGAEYQFLEYEIIDEDVHENSPPCEGIRR